MDSEDNKGNADTNAGGDDYDPHLHREVPKATTNAETLVHLLKGSIGTGILAMPQAFYHSGYAIGVFGTIIIGILCTYCLHILVNSQYILCKRNKVPLLSFPISMKMALETGPPSLRFLSSSAVGIIDGFIVVQQLGICCIYIVFVAENLKQFIDFYWTELDVKYYMLMLLIPLILLICIRNLKLLAPFSTLGNLITFVGLGLILSYVFVNISAPSDREAFGQAKNYPLFIGTVLFSLHSVGVVIAIENNMKTPKAFVGYFGVLNQSMAFVVILYGAFGFVGYLKYGADCKGSISLNLPEKEAAAQVVLIIFAVSIFISYALQAYVPISILWGTYLIQKYENSDRKLLFEFATRLAVVIFTFLLAVAIPRLGLFISLFGALCLCTLGIAFPALMEICVFYPVHLSKFDLCKNIFLIICGIVGLVIGVYTSVRDIVLSFL